MIRRFLAASGILIPLAAGLALPALAEGPIAGDPVAGRKVARMCSACHGINGIAKNPEAANLAGQDAGYLSRQLQAFRDGERKNETMSVMAKNLTDQQIADVAAYFSAIKIEVAPPPAP